MKKVITAGLMVLAMSAGAQAMCVQDQYGGQYDFTIDSAHTYLYGSATMPAGLCGAPVWLLTGSFVNSGGTKYELTAANPLGESDPSCIATFKIKGTYPNGAWYYTGGYGGQEFQLIDCVAAAASADAEGLQQGGPLR
jgi:hypothetical protein